MLILRQVVRYGIVYVIMVVLFVALLGARK
jgi:hypothetical protein